jgi:Flp pilus assembly CpaE family ATPase
MTSPSRIILASDNAALQERFAAGLGDMAALAVVSPAAGELLAAVVEARPTLIVVELSAHTTLHPLVALVRRADPAIRIVAVGDATSVEAVLGAVRSGAADFLDRSATPEVIRNLVARHLRAAAEEARLVPVAAEAKGAAAVATSSFEIVLAPQTGGGENLFAINLAAMKAKAGAEMLLIDCALPGTEADAALDIPISYTVDNALKDLGRFDRTLAVSTLARHAESGLMVLPLATAGSPDIEAVGREALSRLLGVIRPMFRDVLLNVGGVRSPELLLEIMRAATRIYVVCPQKFTAVAEAQRLLERVGPEVEVFQRMVLLVDEHQPAITLTEEQMRNTLGIAQSVRLPPARAELINGLNIGRPLALDQPKHPYVQALARLAADERRAPQPRPTQLINQALTEARKRIGLRKAA